jgi:exosortase A-associated hydrolase 1
MGDSTGDLLTFEQIEHDLQCAIETFLAQVPQLEEVVLWALCDAASAALMFGPRHPRVQGMVLLNPWVRSEFTLSQARIRHYYGRRLLSGELWSKALRGQLDWRNSLRSLARTLRTARPGAPELAAPTAGAQACARTFQKRMAQGLQRFAGPVLLVISGNDLTAKEFIDHAAQDPDWTVALARPRLSRLDLPHADHTFSKTSWQSEVERATLAWLNTW